HPLPGDAALRAMAAAPWPAHPRRYSAAHIAATDWMGVGVDRRHPWSRMLALLRAQRSKGSGCQLPVKCDLYQDARYARVVVAGTDADCLCRRLDRISFPHA